MSKLHRLSCVAIILLVIAIMSGCGKAANQAAGGEDAGSSPNTVQATADTQSVDSTEKSEISATRTVHDAKGEVTIPVNPQRIADISGSTEELLVLGYQPILSGNTDMADPTALTPILTAKLGEQVSTAGWFQTEINLEAVMAAAPDLIIAGPTQEKVYEQLSKIAPTVRVPYGFSSFRERFAFVADIMGKTTEMEQWLRSYDERAEELRNQIVNNIGQETFAVIEATQKEIRIYARTGVADILFNDLGMQAAPGTPEPDAWGGKVTSLEALSSFEPDHIILMADSEDNVLKDINIWSSTKAVKAGHVYGMTTRQNYNEAFFAMGKLAVLEQIASEILADK
jgi:iron complex transport system substrate-binding protein